MRRALIVVVAIAGAIALAGCGGSDDEREGSLSPSAPPAPMGTATPSSLTFAQEDLGNTSAPKAVTLQAGPPCTSSCPRVQLDTETTRFTPPGDFKVASDDCPTILKDDDRCTVQIVFSPIGDAQRTATFESGTEKNVAEAKRYPGPTVTVSGVARTPKASKKK